MMNKPVYLSKVATFDAAHMLSNYSGKCTNLHGHTYKVEASCQGFPVDDKSREDFCMVLDFNVLSSRLKEVVDMLDHALIFSHENYQDASEQALYLWALNFNKKYVKLSGRCTAECIATWIRDKLSDKLLQDVDLPQKATTYIRLWETPTSYTEVYM